MQFKQHLKIKLSFELPRYNCKPLHGRRGEKIKSSPREEKIFVKKRERKTWMSDQGESFPFFPNSILKGTRRVNLSLEN